MNIARSEEQRLFTESLHRILETENEFKHRRRRLDDPAPRTVAAMAWTAGLRFNRLRVPAGQRLLFAVPASETLADDIEWILLGRGIYRHRIIAIDVQSRHAIPRRSIGDVRDRRAPGEAGVLGVTIVLADENDRQLPYRGQIQGLMECVDIGGAFAEIGDGDTPLAKELRGERQAADYGWPPHLIGRPRRVHASSLSRKSCPLLSSSLGACADAAMIL